MSADIDYDIIVVGAGPAGSTAGYLLKKSGLNVLVIDKDKFPRKKLCGGMITLKTLQLLKTIYGETPSSLRDKKIIDFSTFDYEINYRMSRIVSKKTSESPYNFVDRTIYDNFLFEKAKEAGVEVIEGEMVKSVDIDNCEVFLSNGDKYKSKYLVGADGINSMVRKDFIKKGVINKKKWENYMATGLEVFVDRNKLDNDIYHVPIVSFGVIKWGYAWLFPNEDRLVIGLGGLNKENKGNFRNALQDWFSCLKIDSNAIGKIYGHPIPFGNFQIIPVYKNKVFLLGDAGGFVCPLFGEGLYLSMKTAEIMTDAINLHDPSKKIFAGKLFIKGLKKEVYPELKAALTLRRLCFSKFGTAFKYKVTGFLVKLLGEKFIEMMHGERSYKWLRKKNLNLLQILEE